MSNAKSINNQQLTECAQRIMQLIVPKHVSTERIQQIQDELVYKLTVNLPKLDKKYISEILKGDDSKVAQCLWELIVINHLAECSDVIDVKEHIDSGPDWLITMKDGTSYYVEATCIGLPTKSNDSEILRVLQEAQTHRSYNTGTSIVDEIRARVSGVISEKLKKHDKFMKDKNIGYLMFVSYGNPHIPSIHCDLFTAVRAVYPFGDLSVDINYSTAGITSTSASYYPFSDNYQKANGAIIPTYILGNPTYDWISGIIISGVNLLYLIDAAIGIGGTSWKDGINNDFVLALNPVATHAIDSTFNTATQISDIANGQPITQGRKIFPTF